MTTTLINILVPLKNGRGEFSFPSVFPQDNLATVYLTCFASIIEPLNQNPPVLFLTSQSSKHRLHATAGYLPNIIACLPVSAQNTTYHIGLNPQNVPCNMLNQTITLVVVNKELEPVESANGHLLMGIQGPVENLLFI